MSDPDNAGSVSWLRELADKAEANRLQGRWKLDRAATTLARRQLDYLAPDIARKLAAAAEVLAYEEGHDGDLKGCPGCELLASLAALNPKEDA